MTSATNKVRKARRKPALDGAPRQSLHGATLEKLRDYVVEGNLTDGERIPEKQLCELFGISRTPLREALKVLAAEGLIDLLPNRGARVRSLESAQLQELFDVMGGQEALAGRLACENITREELAEIESIHHTMYGHYLRRDMHRYFECNQKIHEMILTASRNARLIQDYARTASQLRRLRYNANHARKRERWGEAMREHEEMLDALLRRAGNEMSDILFRHLRNKGKAAADYVAEITVDGQDKAPEPFEIAIAERLTRTA
jgi:DNA-binding GntR family transcriptional regulator